MYYLEDRHPQFEYGCYIKVGTAVPYISPWRGDDFQDVIRLIKDIEKRHSRTGQHYYIDNDFYNNEFSKSNYVYYYRFLVRPINDWKQLKHKSTRAQTMQKAA